MQTCIHTLIHTQNHNKHINAQQNYYVLTYIIKLYIHKSVWFNKNTNKRFFNMMKNDLIM